MRNKSYSKRIEDAQVMLSGINHYKKSLADRGIDDEYIERLKALIEKCINLLNTRAQTAAALKNLTAERNANLDKLDREIQFCKRGAKINIPKTLWNAFGFIYRPRGPKAKPGPENPPDLSPGKRGEKWDGASKGQNVPGKILKNGHLLPTFCHFPAKKIYWEPGLRLRKSSRENLFLAAKDAKDAKRGLYRLSPF